MTVVLKKDGRVMWRGKQVGVFTRLGLPNADPLWHFKSLDGSGPPDLTTTMRKFIYWHVTRHETNREQRKR